MDTKKFEYLETIREAIETGDYEELDEFVEDIRDRVKHDPDFAELFGEIQSRKYGDVISLIDEFIYQDLQQEFGEVKEEEMLEHINGRVFPGADAFMESEPDEISFEEFHEEEFASGAGYEDE
jgi:hypothetical protein